MGLGLAGVQWAGLGEESGLASWLLAGGARRTWNAESKANGGWVLM
jgi:hypothetical protein